MYRELKKQSSIRLKIQSLSNNYHFLAICIVLVALTTASHYCLFLLGGYLFFCYKRTAFFKVILISTVISAFLIISSNNKKTEIMPNSKEIEVKVLEFNKISNYYKIIGRFNNEKVLIYYYQDFSYKCGDYVLFTGKLSNPKPGSFEGDFDYQEYLFNKNIYYLFQANSAILVKEGHSITNIRYTLVNYYETTKDEKTFSYIKAIVFADKSSYDDEFIATTNSIGISHLFAISGLHINFIFMGIYLTLKKITKESTLSMNIALMILGLYILLIGAIHSALRAFLMLLLTDMNKRYQFYLTKLDIFSITLIITFILNPKAINEVGYILSYLVTFGMIVCYDVLYDKVKIKNLFKIGLFCYLIALPIIINMNNEINIATPFICALYGLIFSSIILPLSFISLLPTIDLPYIFGIFNTLIELSDFSALQRNYTYLRIEFILIYYFIFYLLLKDIALKKSYYKKALILLVYLVLVNNIIILANNSSITFIDVGQGDSTLIRTNKNKLILIDTFGKSDKYLKSLGVNKIDHLILTHSDNDHIGNLAEIVKSFEVKNLYINSFDSIEDYPGYDNSIKVIKVSSDDDIKIDDLTLNVLGPITNDSSDNNLSIVLYFSLEIDFLLCGDMEKVAEEKLVSKYKEQLNCDVLKVGHHGSSTSTTSTLIKYTTPRYSIISAGIDNRYGFPHQEVLTRLKDSTIFQTATQGNITFIIKKDNYQIKTYR